MDSHHAYRGRRTLEEIRQKRAAERLQKASSGSDLEPSNSYGIPNYEAGGRFLEKDSNALLFRVNELEKNVADMELENGDLKSKFDAKLAENESLLRRINVLERESLPSMKKSLQDLSIEKDAAVVAREDLSTQVRTLKKRLKEAEEEQYRAEEDAAALRAELNSMQQQEMRSHYNDVASMDRTSDVIKSMEMEILELKAQLQKEVVNKQEGLKMLDEEKLRSNTLLAEKQELEQRLTTLSMTSDELLKNAGSNAELKQEKVRLEKQLHDMAVMIERLETGRQKLLMEVDSQSSQIEELYEQNASLSASYNDSLRALEEWESQVANCLEQNNELRETLQKLRTEHLGAVNVVNTLPAVDPQGDRKHSSNPDGVNSLQQLNSQLAEERIRSEALSAEVLRLSAELKRAVQSYNRLTWLYRPVLRSIEDGLMKMKHESSISV